jgi:catechol 2,3-dioxygenase-like lactoylglutathione lyase family enzyme
MPIDHVKIPCTDLDASRAFYTAALAPFGYKLVYDGEESLGFGIGDGGDDDEPFDGRAANRPSRSIARPTTARSRWRRHSAAPRSSGASASQRSSGCRG